MAKSRLRRMHPRWLEATTPKRLKRGHLAQSLNEDTVRGQTPCSYEVQLLDVHWGTLMAESHIPRARLESARCTPMAESHIPRARLEAARCTPMAENHIPRARLKAAKKSLHLFPAFGLRESGGAASTASSAQGSVLTGVPPAGSAFARRWRKAAATVEVLGPLLGGLSLLAAEGSKPLSSSALRRLPCASAPLNSNPWNFHSVNSGKVIPFSRKCPDNPDMRARPPDNMKE